MERDTKWHKDWKNVFGKENTEIVLQNGYEKHFADIVTKNNVVIKLLSTTISEKKIKEMERFYGTRMMWLVDGSNKLDFFTYYHKYDLSYLILNSQDQFYIRYPQTTIEELDTIKNDISPISAKRLFKLALYAQNPIILDFGSEYLLRITEFKDTKRGKGNLVKRERFLERYS